MPAPPTLPELINDAVDRLYGGVRTRLAEEMEISISFLGKVVEGKFVFSVENCLSFAEKTGLHPADIFAASGHIETYDRIVRLFGRANPSIAAPMSSDVRLLVRLFHKLTRPTQEAIVTLCRALVRQ